MGTPSDLEKSVKSQGAPTSIIGPAAPRFHESFAEFLSLLRQAAARKCLLEEREIPSDSITVGVFNGCRLALARGKPWLGGLGPKGGFLGGFFANLKLGIHSIAYKKFNRDTKNCDGVGRNASNNNTLFLFAGMAF